MEFCVLGPVEAWAGGERVALGPAKVRCVLAVLLRTPGVLVTTEALVDRVWDEHPPGASVRYKYVGLLRAALQPHGVDLLSTGGGYDVPEPARGAGQGGREVRELRSRSRPGRSLLGATPILGSRTCPASSCKTLRGQHRTLTPPGSCIDAALAESRCARWWT